METNERLTAMNMSPLKILCIVLWIVSVYFAITTGVWKDPTYLMIASFATLSVWAGVIP